MLLNRILCACRFDIDISYIEGYYGYKNYARAVALETVYI